MTRYTECLPRFLVVPSHAPAGTTYAVVDRATGKWSTFYSREDANALRDWLIVRAAGYPANLTLLAIL